jgi:50S ribosomal protein L16 3-hydroxylase
MTQGEAPDILLAWQTLSVHKKLGAGRLQHHDQSSLYEAYLAGWVVFEQ